MELLFECDAGIGAAARLASSSSGASVVGEPFASTGIADVLPPALELVPPDVPGHASAAHRS